jgi:apolipoprotein D and lipocalin family protein
MSQTLKVVSAVALLSTLFGCASLPKGALAVSGFEKEKYLGKWYEIARYDFAFERNLSDTTAEYALLADGAIGVTNRGFNYVKNKWEEARGRARFRGPEDRGELEVSFFGPFYAAYNVIALDAEYRYALVAGSSTKYLWMLSRTTDIPEAVKTEYLSIAKSLGYDTGKLIWVKQSR